MPPTIQLKRGTASALTSANPFPLVGEIIFEQNTGLFKIGDGIRAWNALPYANPQGSLTVAISNIIGLQEALNAKADINHPHSIANITGLQTALDRKATTTALGGVIVGDNLSVDANGRLAAEVGEAPTDLGAYVRYNADWVNVNTALTNSREWSASTVSQADAEAGTSTSRFAFTPQRVFQAIAAWWAGSAAKTKLDGIATGATANATDAQLRDRSTHTGTQAISTVSGLQTALDSKQATGNYATLDGSGKVPAIQLPSYVDDVIEAANLAALPGTGETGKIYVTLNTNKAYRWSGSAYVEIIPSPGSTDSVAEGSTNLYYTNTRAAAAAPVQSVAGRTGAVTLTKTDVGLGNVPNADATARANHTGTQTLATISDAGTAAALNVAAAGANASTSQVVRGDDTRLTNARTPTAHSHTGADVTVTDYDGQNPATLEDGNLGPFLWNLSIPSTTGTGYATRIAQNRAALGVGYGTTGTTVCVGNDARLSDARTPTAHKSSHATGGADALTAADIGAAATSHTQAFSTITSTPTTLSGYGITDAASSTHTHGNLTSAGLISGNTASGQIVVTTTGGALTTAATISSSQVSGLATVASSGSYNDLSNKPTIPSAYTLPTASATVLGGVKIGSGISIDGSGVISASSGYTLPNATTSTLGGVIVGTGLGVSTGTVSVTYGTTSGTACQGNDSRLSDARTPLSHSHTVSDLPVGTGSTQVAAGNHVHGNITTDGRIGSTSGQIVVTTTGGALTTAATIAAGSVTGLATVATSGSASDIITGTLPVAQLPTTGVSAGILTTGTLARGRYSSDLGSGSMTVSGSNSFGFSLDSTARTLSQANTLSIMGGQVGIGTLSPTSSGPGTRLLDIVTDIGSATGQTGNREVFRIRNSSTGNSFEIALGESTYGSGRVRFLANGVLFADVVEVGAARQLSFSSGIRFQNNAQIVGDSNANAYIEMNNGAGQLSLSGVSAISFQRSYTEVGRWDTNSAWNVGTSHATVSGCAGASVSGTQARARFPSQVSTSAGQFAAAGDAQASRYHLRNTTTDAATSTVLFRDGSSLRLTIPARSCWMFKARVTAYNSTDEIGAAWDIAGSIRRNAANGTALVGTPTSTAYTEGAMSGATVTVTADDTNEALQIAVTGLAAKTVRWHAVIETSEVSAGTPS